MKQKKIQNGQLKKTEFFNPSGSKAEQFSPKFHRLVLGIVGLIDGNFVLEWMGLNFYYYDGLQPKMSLGIINEHECTYLQSNHSSQFVDSN